VKTIGLLGGMSWESSALYYRLINEDTQRRLGGLHNAPTIMLTVDFSEIEKLQEAGDWDTAGDILTDAARRLEAAGAEILVLATNTMHIVAEKIAAAIDVPFLHIADATAEAVKASGVTTVGLLGTRFTMEKAFYAERLCRRHGLEVLVPGDADRVLVNEVIYNELVRGVINDASREAFREVIARLSERGACGVVLGCTEIGLLVSQDDSPVPVFDTTRIHAEQAVTMALQPDA